MSRMSASLPAHERRFHGVGVSPGIARGTVFVYRPEDEDPPSRADRRVGNRRRDRAVRDRAARHARTRSWSCRRRIAELDRRERRQHLRRASARGRGSHADRRSAAHPAARQDRTSSTFSPQVASRYAKTLSEIDDPYLRERALDIHDVTRRVIRNLMGKVGRDLSAPSTPAHPRRAQSDAVRHRAAQSQARARFRDRHRQQDFAHRHHGAVAEYPRGRRPARPHDAAHHRRSRPARWLQRPRHPQSRPTRRSGNTASWRSRSARSRRSSPSCARPSRRTTRRPPRHPLGEYRIARGHGLTSAERRGRRRALSHRVLLPQSHRAPDRGGPVPGLPPGRGERAAALASSSARSISAATNP